MPNWALAAIILSQAVASPQSPVGTYEPDLHLAPKASKGALETIFGRSVLRISSDGRFSFCGIRQSGFWRLHKGSLVLIHEGFMGVPFAVPDEVLKRSWPDDHLSGLVMQRKGSETLELRKFGAFAGPIRFIRKPSRPTRDLVADSYKDDEGVAEGAYSELADELPTRWRDLRAMIDDPKAPSELRLWAATLWHGPPSADVTEAMVELAGGLDPKGLTERQARAIRRTLGRNLKAIATQTAIPAMIRLEEKSFISRKDVADAIGRTRHAESIPLLKRWLGSSGPYERSAACEALASLQAKGQLEFIRPLAKDSEPQARIGALSAISRLSDDLDERESAVRTLAQELRGDWLDATYAAESLGASGSRSAVRPLVAALARSDNVFVRRVAAEQLGKLGFAEAIPALIEAKLGERQQWTREFSPEGQRDPLPARLGFLSQSVEDAPVRKAAAEALWLFDSRSRAQENLPAVHSRERPANRRAAH